MTAASVSAGTVLSDTLGIKTPTCPLLRIPDFSRVIVGTLITLQETWRPDSICRMLEKLGGGNPLLANGRLALAVDSSLKQEEIHEATLVRVAAKPSRYDATDICTTVLCVLCECRVVDVTFDGPYCQATRVPDLVPLLRLRNFTPNPSWFIDHHHAKITARDETVALLEELAGVGESIEEAKDHCVLVCDSQASMTAGLEGTLARIIQVKGHRHEQPSAFQPIECVLKLFGRVRCAEVHTNGSFPQVSLKDMSLWPIHQISPFITPSELPKGQLFLHIKTGSLLELLEQLGNGDCQRAVGALVPLGCDSDESTGSPAMGGSTGRVKFMRITEVQQVRDEPSDKWYSLALMDVSVIKGILRERSGQQQWPQVSIRLPAVWIKTTMGRLASLKSSGSGSDLVGLRSAAFRTRSIEDVATGTATIIETTTRAASSPAVTAIAAKDCPVWQECLHALKRILDESGLADDLNKYRDESADQCFCWDCHTIRGDRMVYERGGKSYVLPVGYARVGLKPAKTHAYKDTGLMKWHVGFHGTTHKNIADLLKTGHLLTPGSHTLSGNRIRVREGHIEESFLRKNEHTDEMESFDPRDKIFFSPSISYCAYENVYMDEATVSGKKYRFGFQVRLQPGTYDIGQQTVQPDGSDYPIDPHWPNSCIEWYTNQVHTHFFTGILIGENQTVTLADDLKTIFY